MIVHRHTKPVKPGREEEALELLKEVRKRHGACRLYQNSLGTNNQIVMELEFENLAALEKFWSEWSALPTTPAFSEKWLELIETGGTSETWNLIE